MSDAVVLDTSFLISLADRNRGCHGAAKAYNKYFLDKKIVMLLPTVVAAEFALKQPITDLPLRNFRVLPFNLTEAQRCADLNVTYFRKATGLVGQRDAVKDDFKIIAQTVEQQAGFLITEDEETLAKYYDLLKAEGKLRFAVIPLKQGFDESRANENGQCGLPMDI